MANDIIDITVTDNSDNVQINATPNLVTINVSNTSGNIVGSNYYLVSSYAALPVVGDSTTLYITNDTSLMYRWNGSAYIQVNSVTSWGTITGTLSNQTDLQTALNLKAPLASPTFTGTVSGITKSMVGLSNVDNTSDVNKPISSATQTALDGKEPTITAGTSNQYYRGDKTFQSLVTTAVAEGTNLYFTNARSRGAISLTTVGTSGAATYDNTTGILNVPAYLGGVTSFNTRTGAITLTSGDVTTALGFTPVTDARTITINGTTYDLTANRSWTIASGVTSFNTRTGAIVPTAEDYTTALVTEDTNLYYTNTRSRNAISLTTTGTSGSATYDNTTGILNIPAYQGGVTSFNTRTGAITLSSSDVTTALGYTPYNATNPNGYTSNVGTVTSVGGTGTVSGLSLSGSVTTSGNLTLGGTLSLTSGNVTSALGYTPENSANKGIANGYASLDGGGLVPSTQLPSYVDDVLEFADLAAFPASGTTGKIYVALDTNKIYRWSGATYIEVSPSVGTIWGGITGTLSNQTDLQNALNAKQDDLNGTGFVKASGTTITYDNSTYYPYPTGDTTQYVSGDGSLIAFPIAGQSGTIVRLVRNNTGATLTKGTVIYISGATGNNPIVSKAIATGDATSAQTFGLCQANIANNATGYVVVMGDLIGLDTSAFTEGQQVYLSGTVAGTYTATKQYAPNHLVYIGVITRAHPTLGQIEVKIQNGYEMDELHNVSAQSPANNDGIFYNTTTSLWEKKSIATALGFTPYNATNPNNYISLTALSSSATGLTYTNTTGVFSLTAGYEIPTSASATNWDSAYTNRITSLTTTGSSGSATLVSNVLNIPTYTLSGLGGQVALNGTGFVKISGTTISYDNSTYYLASNPSGYTTNVGTVTSVAAITLGTTGTDLSSSVATGTTTPVITLNVPTASATNRGVLSSADWTTFNNKQGTITLTTTGTSGAATLTGSTLNIPQYASTPLSGTTNYVAKFTSSTGIGNSNIQDNGSVITLGMSQITIGTSGSQFFIYPAFSANLNLLQNYNGSAYTTEEHRASDYNFKIGTTSALTIASTGKATFSADILVTADIISNYGVTVARNGSNTEASGPYFMLSNAAYNQIWYQQLNASNGIDYWYNGSRKMTLTSAGNILIGTTTDNGNKLQVNGTAVANNFYSVTGTQYVVMNVWTTFYTLAADQGIYSISIGFGDFPMESWYACGIVFSGISRSIFLSLANGSIVLMRTQGLAVQVYLTSSAGANREMPFKILRS